MATITINQRNTFSIGDSNDVIGTSSPTGSVGIEKTVGHTGFFIYSPQSYTLWLKNSSGVWASYQSISNSASGYQGGQTFAWYDFTAAYIVTTESSHTVHVYGRDGAVLVDGDPTDGDQSMSTLVMDGNLSYVVRYGAANGGAGTQGPQGAAGPAGADGAQGPAGADGVDGTSGDMGGTMTDHILPDTNAAYDLGNAEYKIRHLFLSDNSMYIGDTWIKAEGDQIKTPNLLVGDINLNNEGRSNEVDGTSGHWSIQEGTDDLFLINRKTGKKFKFNITEV